jgi:hypothetical protein
MKEKKLKSAKSPFMPFEDKTALVPVYVKGPGTPKGYEVAKIEIIMKKSPVVNPNPMDLKKAVAIAKKPITKTVAKKAVAKKADVKKKDAKKKVGKKKK